MIELGKKEPYVGMENKLQEAVCVCINWHPSTKVDEGKKAVCSYCKLNRHMQNV